MPFIDSLDIGNRACQLLGVRAIASVDEISKNNREISNAYDKMRRIEMRRNVWRFAVRKAVLRAVDTTTMIVLPSDYDASATYLPGAIVADTNGALWISIAPENVNNTPGGNNDNTWADHIGLRSTTTPDNPPAGDTSR